ncbi:unnamed protein product, partial [Rotaria sp. Silwood1]
NLGMEGFRALGYEPNAVVSCLPAGIELDGRATSVRSSITLLTEAICESMLQLTAKNSTTIGVINGGAVRIDDILRNKITQYDVIRALPFSSVVVVLSIPGRLLAQVLTTGISLKGDGMYLAYTRVEISDDGKTWLYNGTDISTSDLYYNVATIDYVRNTTQLKS